MTNTELPTLMTAHSINLRVLRASNDSDEYTFLDDIEQYVHAIVSGDVVLVKRSEIVDVQSAINAAIAVLERADRRTFGACANNMRGAASDIADWLTPSQKEEA